MNEDLTFENRNSIRDGCGVTFKGDFWYFGGTSIQNRQVHFLEFSLNHNLFIL